MSLSDTHIPTSGDRVPEPDNPHAARRFRFPLRFDPVRLLAGVLSRWPWIVIGMILFGGLGTMAGHLLTRPSFSLSVALIKRRVPQTVQTSEIGQSFRPSDLNDATLLATLLASEPRDLAFKRAKNGIDPAYGASFVEASQLENTDIFYITYHSPISPEDAMQVTGIWAEEISEYTMRLQQSEARSVLTILTKEVAGLEERIEASNRELLEFAKARQFIGGEAQVTAVLDKLSQIELKLEDARASAKAMREQLADLEKTIRHHSPLELSLRAAKEELANLRSTYTDDNPLVQAKLEGIAYIEKQLATLGDGQNADLESFTGTPLGNQLYLDIIALRNRLAETTDLIGALEKQRESTAARLAEFPSIITQYDALRAKRDSFISQLSLMSKRLKEAEIFASGSPGYWQMFQPPDVRQVVPSSLVRKPVLLGAAGMASGAFVSVLFTLLLTHRTTRRSVLECCSCTGAPLLGMLPSNQTEHHAFHDLWLANLTTNTQDGENPLLIWTAALKPEEERIFWQGLSKASREDTGIPMEVCDLTPDQIWAGFPIPDDLRWQSAGEHRRILRASSLPTSEARGKLAAANRWFAVVRGDQSSLRTFSESRRLAEIHLKPCDGTIALIEPPSGCLRRWADQLSIFIARKFS